MGSDFHFFFLFVCVTSADSLSSSSSSSSVRRGVYHREDGGQWGGSEQVCSAQWAATPQQRTSVVSAFDRFRSSSSASSRPTNLVSGPRGAVVMCWRSPKCAGARRVYSVDDGREVWSREAEPPFSVSGFARVCRPLAPFGNLTASHTGDELDSIKSAMAAALVLTWITTWLLHVEDAEQCQWDLWLLTQLYV